MIPYYLLSVRTVNNICKQFYSQTTLKGNWYLEQLKERTILKIKGEKSYDLLQGLITNDMNLLKNQKAIYAMFLNSKGRVLYDSIVYKTNCENTIFLECDINCASDIVKHLTMYKVRRKIDILQGEYAIWVVFKPNNEGKEDFKLELSERCIICSDPRLSELGYRVIVPHDANLSTNLDDKSNFSYKKYRYKLGVAEGIEELPKEKCFPLELNCDYLNGVSFNKGCYIGQELTARTHHTGVVRKRIMPLSFAIPPENIKLEEPILDSSSNRAVGKLRGLCEDSGLGLMRVTETLGSSALTIEHINLKCCMPLWWPQSQHNSLKKSV